MDSEICIAFERYRMDRERESFPFFARQLAHWIRWSRRYMDRIPSDVPLARILRKMDRAHRRSR